MCLFLTALSGFSSESPIAIDQPAFAFEDHLERSFKGVRVAMFESLGLPWEPEVREKVLAQAAVFESLGCVVEQAEPDFTDANEAFMAQRHAYYEARFGDVVDAHPGINNEYVHWHVEQARKLTVPYLSRTENKRAELFHRARRFMQTYEFFIMPVSQVLPFDVTTHYPTAIAGVAMENYIAWMKSADYISAIGNPAISVPAAFSQSGLPIGIQIVGRHHDDLGVLQLAYAFEQATRTGLRRPKIATIAER